jgi:S1-C subfamily serine protease
LISDRTKKETALTFTRDGERRSVAARLVPLSELIRQKIGVSAQELTRELADNFGYNPREGLLISGVESNGPAARAELQPGYLIAGIDGQNTPDLLSAAGVLAGKKKGDSAELTVTVRRQRGGLVRNSQGNVTVRVR